MAVLKPRSRMLSVRLSEDEYSALRRACIVAGARSVSDLTRDAVRVLLNSPNREEFFGSYFVEFQAQMRNLDRKLDQLATEIQSRRSAASNE